MNTDKKTKHMKSLGDKARKKLEKERNIWVATVRADGRPHMVPVWFVALSDAIFICTAPNSVKAKNVGANANVALALEDGSHPVICEGQAKNVGQPWPQAVVEAFRKKYDWDITEETQYTLLLEIEPRKWLAW